MKRVWILLAALLMSACAGGGNPTTVAVYDFGLPAAPLAAEGKWSRLALELKSPSWFDSLHVGYRLAYDDPLKHHEYAASRWVSAPDSLLAQRLRQQLGSASVNGNIPFDCLLRVELQEFSQLFDTPQNSRGVLQVVVSLIDVRRQTVSERRLFIDKPAATPDARGGVGALVAASTELGLRLSSWLDRLNEQNTPGICRAK